MIRQPDDQYALLCIQNALQELLDAEKQKRKQERNEKLAAKKAKQEAIKMQKKALEAAKSTPAVINPLLEGDNKADLESDDKADIRPSNLASRETSAQPMPEKILNDKILNDNSADPTR